MYTVLQITCKRCLSKNTYFYLTYHVLFIFNSRNTVSIHIVLYAFVFIFFIYKLKRTYLFTCLIRPFEMLNYFCLNPRDSVFIYSFYYRFFFYSFFFHFPLSFFFHVFGYACVIISIHYYITIFNRYTHPYSIFFKL